MHGYLEQQSMTFDDEYNCKVFDQSAINTEKMFYIQAGVNQSIDYFVFDVTNGITWLRNLLLKIIIIPEKLYMRTNIISVVEGKKRKYLVQYILYILYCRKDSSAGFHRYSTAFGVLSKQNSRIYNIYTAKLRFYHVREFQG